MALYCQWEQFALYLYLQYYQRAGALVSGVGITASVACRVNPNGEAWRNEYIRDMLMTLPSMMAVLHNRLQHIQSLAALGLTATARSCSESLRDPSFLSWAGPPPPGPAQARVASLCLHPHISCWQLEAAVRGSDAAAVHRDRRTGTARVTIVIQPSDPPPSLSPSVSGPATAGTGCSHLPVLKWQFESSAQDCDRHSNGGISVSLVGMIVEARVHTVEVFGVGNKSGSLPAIGNPKNPMGGGLQKR